MKIETVALDDQQTKLIAELDSETLEKYKHQAARKIAQSAKVPGFRPGKAPYDVIRRMYGDDAIQQEAIESMMKDIYPQILKEANIEPSGPGKLDEIVSYDPPTFAFIVPLPPQVILGEYKEIRKEYEPTPVTDEQIDQSLLGLRRSLATTETVERPAEKGDMVSVLLSAKRTQVEEGEPDTLIEAAPFEMVAGEPDENQAEPWPYEGFSDELLGMSTGESKTVAHTFSEETPYEDLRGVEATFTIEVQSIKKMELPEANDEFAQTVGPFETIEAVRNAIRQQLQQNYAQQYDQSYFDDVIGQLVAQATIKFPPHILEDEIEQFLHGVEHNLEHDHLDLDTYLKMRQLDRETFIEQEVKPAALRRLERSLAMEQFAKEEHVEVKSEEIRSIYFAAMQQVQQSPEFQKTQNRTKQSQQEMANELAVSTINRILSQRMMSRLQAIATGHGDDQPEIAAAEDTLDLVADEEIVFDPAVTEAEVVETSAVEVAAEEVTSEEVASEEVTSASKAEETEAAPAEDQKAEE